MEYLNEKGKEDKYFVGSQSVGEECKEYSIPANLNKFIVSWVENVNIEFEEPDETKEAVFTVEEFISLYTLQHKLILNINTNEYAWEKKH
uniref:Uncharacterized protein n=1 Tax=Meloidogyne enterolobii TaxID=390850 RepID=A0A6V7W5A4_MELEN|nr:unnamed protein product [Meloidogyne enterolobii]